ATLSDKWRPPANFFVSASRVGVAYDIGFPFEMRINIIKLCHSIPLVYFYAIVFRVAAAQHEPCDVILRMVLVSVNVHPSIAKCCGPVGAATCRTWFAFFRSLLHVVIFCPVRTATFLG